MARLTPGLPASTSSSMARLTPGLSIISVDIVVDGQPPCWTLIFLSTSSLMASFRAGLHLTPASALGFHCCQHPRWTFIVASIRAGLLLLASTSSSTASLCAGLVLSFSSTSSSTASASCWSWALFFVDIVVDGQRLLLDLHHWSVVLTSSSQASK